MGGAACKIIIEGQLAYYVTEQVGWNNDVRTELLEAAINASCNGIQFAEIYEKLNNGYISDSIRTDIIDIHDKIINELPKEQDDKQLQKLIDTLTDKLFFAARKLYNTELSDGINLDKLRKMLYKQNKGEKDD